MCWGFHIRLCGNCGVEMLRLQVLGGGFRALLEPWEGEPYDGSVCHVCPRMARWVPNREGLMVFQFKVW